VGGSAVVGGPSLLGLLQLGVGESTSSAAALGYCWKVPIAGWPPASLGAVGEKPQPQANRD
jgi:hypothetical protein